MTPARRRGSLLLRYCTFLLGLAVMSIGVSLSVHALIGTTPISAVPLVLSYATPPSLGVYTIGLNLVLLLAQIAVLRRRFEPVQLLQLPAAFAFGAACDLSVWLLRGIEPVAYPAQLGLSLLGSLVVGVGVWLQVTPRVLTLSGDGFAVAVARVTGRQFSTVKMLTDSALVLLAVLLSLVLLGGLHGVREGTIVAAVLVGYVVRLLHRFVPWPAVLSRPREGDAGRAGPAGGTAA
ncbi:YitT family protein [Gulosibacter sp. 10]|uniref:YczE/YyaS/YitT family protein n=1 Tax=Gulosibacter sp. 10 TaxID=1255570 RepID=UPI00097EE66A|nr:DUF6198 family protein [Gulosibacter sp. 10]SJM67480.1 hypothetical protein FM112_12620 [Gulosibacter sp. 10]